VPGLLLWAQWLADMDRLLHSRRSAAAWHTAADASSVMLSADVEG